MGRFYKGLNVKTPPFNRADAKSFQILNILKRSGLPVKYNNLLDWGTFQGKIAKATGKLLGIPRKHIYGADVKRQDGIDSSVNYIPVTNGYQVAEVKDDSIALGICSMVIHHVENPEKVLEEFVRILEPGGVLVLREHDISYGERQSVGFIVDILHLFYDYVFEPSLRFNMDKNMTICQGTYHSFEFYIKILERLGMLHVRTEISRNHEKNPFNAGWMVFK